MSEQGSSSENKYAILMETNGKEFESWYYFIKYNGNEEALRHLQSQIDKVDFYILDDPSTFDLDLEHLVSEQTAKEMTKVELNSVMYHRKFDGKLEMIDVGLRKNDKNDKKIVRFFNKLGIGMIADFADDEDIDEEDLTDDSDEDYSDDSDDSTEYEYEISDDSDSDSSGSEDEKPRKNKGKEEDKKLTKKEANDRRVRDMILNMKNRRK